MPPRRPRRPPASRDERDDWSDGNSTRPKSRGRSSPDPLRSWGKVARRGAGQVSRTPDPARRDQTDAHARRPRSPSPRDADQGRWAEDPAPVAEAAASPKKRPPRPRRRIPEAVSRDLVKVMGAKDASAAEKRLLDSGAALERGRAGDALRIVRPLLRRAPDVAAVQEVAALAAYQLGRWEQAAEHAEAFARLSGSFDLHPVLADSYRARKRYRRTEELWDELRQASPSAELVTEGRIVAAGALADQGRLAEAITLLERGPAKKRRTPADHHLRLWYALADLCERAGDVVRARELFARVAEVDADLADTSERLAALR